MEAVHSVNDLVGAAADAYNAGRSKGSDIKLRLQQRLTAILAEKRGERLSEGDVRPELVRLAEELFAAEGRPPDNDEQEALVTKALNEVFGYGPIDGLLRDHEITDVFINGPRQLYFERRGRLETSEAAFDDEEHLLQVVRRMLTGSGRSIDDKSRMVDARLPDGSRLNIVLKPPALNGPLVSIRRFGTRPLTAQDLLVNESLAPEMLDFLAACVKARINLIVSGGTGAGKTTLLNALSVFIPDSERVVTIEDTAELQLQQRHVAKMEALPADPEGGGAVALRDLVKNALRMRPDRLIIGECRGPETADMLQAMNTGHEGGMSTLHANSPREALARIELLMGMSGVDIPMWAVRKLIASSIQLVVQVARVAGGRRKVVAVSEVTGMEGDVISMHELFVYSQTGVDADQASVRCFRSTGNRPHCLHKLQVRGAAISPQVFAERILVTPSGRGPRR
jgi:pilus assembly protein CpaF